VITSDEELRTFYEGISFVPDQLLLDWTARLKSGEVSAEADAIARKIIQDFCLRQWVGEPQSGVTLGWLATQLSSILDNADPLGALGLTKRTKGRPADAELAIRIAWWVKAATLRGYSHRDARTKAADVFCRDVKSIERYEKQAAAWADEMNLANDWEEYFLNLKQARPLPPRIAPA
jgi:hypothetical protein